MSSANGHANSSEPDRTPQNSGTGLDPDCTTLRPPCPYPNRSQRIYPTISHLDWLILYGVLATLSAISFSLLKTFAFPNIYVNLVLH